MEVIFQTVASLGGNHLRTIYSSVPPEKGSTVWFKDHLYEVVRQEWHLDGKPFETEAEVVYPPYVIAVVK